MHDHSDRVSAATDRVLERVDSQPGFHSVADRVPHNAVAEHVLRRAEIQLALTGSMLGETGEPQPVPRIGQIIRIRCTMEARGTSVISRLALGLRAEFSTREGFSPANLQHERCAVRPRRVSAQAAESP
ncbi:hypothetical protein FHX48_002179 [Microbacterium halimionae]|uniref:Uncharacterized protein n=1 Tax=Microbacterium halimionae TaxID=1526413 RepID=A0A7W3JQD7_9MICO|nr:hypothetical protein [Microbacterium halimionae]NII94375.1 hypothetical protein [Microbacterium halimionae]